jgi:hypothetical protein
LVVITIDIATVVMILSKVVLASAVAGDPALLTGFSNISYKE